MFGDFFGDLFGGAESMHRLIARSMGRQWGQGSMVSGTEPDPTDWEKWLRVRGYYMGQMRSYAEALYEQVFPDRAVYEYELWEYILNVFPPPPGMLLGDRLERLKAWCQTMMGARPADIEAAIENLAGSDNVTILEHTAVDCAGDPGRIFDFWTLLDTTTLEDDDTRGDINEIVDRWKPAHTHHGASYGATGAASNTYGGCREMDSAGTTYKPFKTGAGSEKTGRNLTPLN